MNTVCKRVIGIEGDIIEIEPRRDDKLGAGGGAGRHWLAEEDRAYSHSSASASASGASLSSRKTSGSESGLSTKSATGSASPSTSTSISSGSAASTHDEASPSLALAGGSSSSTQRLTPTGRPIDDNDTYDTDEHFNRIYSTSSPKPQARTVDSEGRPLSGYVIGGRRRGQDKYIRIPKGYVWLAGDNMSNSTDSREYGPVPVGLIKGKVLARVSVVWCGV